MRDRVAQHVHEHLGQALEDDAVELGLGPDDRQLDLLACGDRHVAHGARERPGDRRERQRAHADRSVLQLVQQAIADIELVGDALVQARLRVERVLQAAAMGDRLAHQVEQPVELVGRDADRPTRLRWQRDGCGRRRGVAAGRRLARSGVGVDGREGVATDERGAAMLQLAQQIGLALGVPLHVGAQHVHGTQQRLGDLGREDAGPTRLLQHVLDGVGQLRDVVETENPGRPLQRVRVAEQQIDRLAALGDAALAGEQHRHHRVEQLVRLVAEDREELGLVLKHRRSPARPAHHAR